MLLSVSWLTFVGDNFFKSVSYTIEAVCAAPFTEEKENLRAIEAQLLSKRVELSKFETEYREVWAPSNIRQSLALYLFDFTDSFLWFRQVLAQFTEMTSRYAQEMQAVSSMNFMCNSNLVTYLKWFYIPRTKLNCIVLTSSVINRSMSFLRTAMKFMLPIQLFPQ